MINNFLTWEENNVNMQADAAPPEGDAMGTPPAGDDMPPPPAPESDAIIKKTPCQQYPQTTSR